MDGAVAYCSALLKRRLRSRFELDRAMTRRGFEEDDRRRALQLLQEQDLVDDLRFARAWIHTRDALAPRGAPVLRLELMQRGIAKETITAALAERSEQAQEASSGQPDDEALARRLVAGKSRQYAHLLPEVRQRRLMGLLQRRGFSYGVARRILAG